MKKEKAHYLHGAIFTCQNGITLVALIITIILMLILAGVVISLTLGEGGIFNVAKQASKNYVNSAEEERIAISHFLNESKNIINNEEILDIPTIDESVLALKAGDYIKYDSGKNGVITCRVLYPASSEYGLQIVSDKNVKNVTLGSSIYSEAVKSYNNVIEYLNNEAELYLNPDYAYDARCLGSVATAVNGMCTAKDSGATTHVTPTFANASYIKSLDQDSNYITDKTQMEEAEMVTGNGNCWLASRKVASSSDGCWFYVNVMGADGSVTFNCLCHVHPDGGAWSAPFNAGLRPCISLKSDSIKITSGDGQEEKTAYVIEKREI